MCSSRQYSSSKELDISKRKREREKCKRKRKRTERKRNRIGGMDAMSKSRKELEWMDKRTVLWIRIWPNLDPDLGQT